MIPFTRHHWFAFVLPLGLYEHQSCSPHTTYPNVFTSPRIRNCGVYSPPAAASPSAGLAAGGWRAALKARAHWNQMGIRLLGSFNRGLEAYKTLLHFLLISSEALRPAENGSKDFGRR